MAAAFGIHFGANSTCLAVYKDAKTEVIANAAGDRTTPAIVAFSDHDKVVGLAAKQGMIRNAKNTVCHVKRILGLKFNEDAMQKEKLVSQAEIIEQNGSPVYRVSHMGKEISVTPEQCAADIFNTLREIAQHHGDGEVHDTVLTAPYMCSDEQKAALKSAAETAGFNILRIISEPAASLLAYDEGQQDQREQCNCLVLRIGGTSSSATCVNVSNGFYRVLSNFDSSELGGDMFTSALAEHFAKEFNRLYKLDPKESKRSWMKLLNAAESCKHTLTNLPNANCNIDSLHEGIDFNANVARGRMDMLCSHLLSKCQQLILQAVDECGIDKFDINKIILCGGSTKIACVVKKVQEILPNAQLQSSIPSDEVLAIGAAKEASILLVNGLAHSQPDSQLKCVSEEIGICIQGGEYETLFTSGMPVPLKTKRAYICTKDLFKMVLTEGKGEKNIKAKVVLREVGEGSEVFIHISVDMEGSMHITCAEPTSAASTNITVPAMQGDIG